jgi:hypothetical protein
MFGCLLTMTLSVLRRCKNTMHKDKDRQRKEEGLGRYWWIYFCERHRTSREHDEQEQKEDKTEETNTRSTKAINRGNDENYRHALTRKCPAPYEEREKIAMRTVLCQLFSYSAVPFLFSYCTSVLVII